MRSSSAAALIVVFALGACASADSVAAAGRDVADVRREANRRSAIDLATIATGDEPTVVATVSRLLAEPLTEDATVRVALLTNRYLRAAYERLGIARAELVQAGLFRNPVLVANAKRFDAGTEIEAGLAQSVLDAFLIPLRRRVAEAELASERARLTRSLVQTAFDARRALVVVREAEAVVRMQRDAVGIAEASQRLAKRLFDAGNVTGLAMAREDANVARARLDLQAAEMAAQEAREDLNVVLGLWGTDTGWTAAQSPAAEAADSTSLEGVESRAVASSLDLVESRARIEGAAQAAGLVSWEGLFPQLEAGVAAKRDTKDGWGTGPEVAVEIPVFDSGRARVAREQAALRERLEHHHALAVDVRAAARRLRDRAAALRARETYVRQVYLTARERVVHETLLVYNAMQIGAFDVLLARRQEVDALREYLETRRDEAIARLDLEELLAGVLDRERVAARPIPAEHGAETDPSEGGEEHRP